MATKAKNTGNSDSISSRPLESVFSDALGLLDAGKRKEAIQALTVLEGEAVAAGKIGFARAVRVRLTALHAAADDTEVTQAAPALEAQVHLNRQDPDAALVVIEKGLKKAVADARLHYLKALAFAQKNQAEVSAEALGEALKHEPTLIHQFRNERDFDRVRGEAAFAGFELV
jgi:hypothetical protein